MKDSPATPLLDAVKDVEEGEAPAAKSRYSEMMAEEEEEEDPAASEEVGCSSFCGKAEVHQGLHFPAVRKYARDPKAYWKPTAKAWDKMIPHKIKIRGTSYNIKVGDDEVRKTARKLRDITPAGDVIRLDEQSGRAFTLRGFQKYLCYQDPQVLAKEWNRAPLADAEQKFRWYQTQSETRWEHHWHTAVSFAEMVDRDRKRASTSTYEEMVEHWESLDQVNREPLPLQCVAGPAVPIAFWTLQVTWLFFFIVPWPVYWMSYMSDGVHRESKLESWIGIHSQPAKGQAVYPTMIVWSVVGPYILYLMSLEWKVLQYVIIPIVQVTGGFTVFTKRVGFYVWLFFSYGMSLISHLDLVTNGIFLATSWKTYWYELGPKVDCIWTATMRASMFRLIPIGVTTNPDGHYPGIPDDGHFHILRLTDVCHFTFRYLVAWLWVMMLIQAIYGYLGATPLYTIYHRYVKRFSCLGKLYKMESDRKDWNPAGTTEEVRWCPTSKAYKSKQQVTRDCKGQFSESEINDYWEKDMMNTGKGSHIATEAFLSDVVDYNPKGYDYAKAFINQSSGQGTKYQAFFDETHFMDTDHGSAVIALADSCRMYSISAMQVEYSKKKVAYYMDMNNQGPAFGIMRRVLVTLGHKVILSGILQNALQINLQVTFFAMITLLSDPKRTSPLMFTHDAVFSVNAQTFFAIGIGLCNLAKNVFEAFLLFTWVRGVIYVESGLEQNNFRANFLEVLQRKYRFLRACLVVYSLFIAYALFKLVAIFLCPHSMTNLWGCAPINKNDTEGICAGSPLLKNATFMKEMFGPSWATNASDVAF